MPRKNFFLLLLPLLFATACKEQKIAECLKSFRAESILIPADLQKVDGRVQSEVGDAMDGIPVLILYHDSLSCSMCQISHLADLSDVYALADSLGTFEVMSIFSPREEEYDELMKNIVYRDFEYPVYVDFSGSFRKKNSCIPEDAIFHNFLIDRDGHPVFVGNPAASDELWDLLNKALFSID